MNAPMLDEPKAQAVTDAIVAAWPGERAYPKPEEIEAVLRPFAPITYETELRIQRLLREKGASNGATVMVGPWFEANDVAGGEGKDVERRIRFLLADTCTCVLDHLHAAIAEAEKRGKEVDPRVRGLLGHEYFSKRKGE